jgi:hypothetical protein
MKAKQLLLILVAFLFVTITITGCKKYEDGPTISLQFKSWRLANTWKVDETIIGGVSQAGSDDYTIQIKGDGTVISKWTSGGTSFSSETEWEWGDKKETVKFIDGSFTTEVTILRLTSSEFWYENADGTVETHLETSK